jgi:hypothetical protein
MRLPSLFGRIAMVQYPGGREALVGREPAAFAHHGGYPLPPCGVAAPKGGILRRPRDDRTVLGLVIP